jgi:hypothetical protein
MGLWTGACTGHEAAARKDINAGAKAQALTRRRLSFCAGIDGKGSMPCTAVAGHAFLSWRARPPVPHTHPQSVQPAP